ncbi:MAG: LLM class flavin-dependent oxidoreductase [Acidimicrobiaceae bacterium]|nr:LLM class flavin-dependent oxidoreductase [Acidimicrobiaceae bacterium]
MAFDTVPQWHPLMLAQKLATLHNISGGRAFSALGGRHITAPISR